VGKQLRGDHLVHVRNALVLAHRHRVDGMAGGGKALAGNVHRQVAGQGGEILLPGAAIARRVAVDHGARRIASDLCQCQVEGQPPNGVGEVVAPAMADGDADELADMPLQQHRAHHRAEVLEQRREPVIEVGVHQHLDRLGGDQRQRLDRRRRAGDVVGRALQAEGKVLPQVADRGGPGGKRG
jgi:hypothetical protein